jgi:hypothetical protein
MLSPELLDCEWSLDSQVFPVENASSERVARGRDFAISAAFSAFTARLPLSWQPQVRVLTNRWRSFNRYVRECLDRQIDFQP